MVGFLVACAAAALMGFLAGMGVGGGSLLLLWMTQVAQLGQTQARITNLLFYLPAAAIATIFRKKENTVVGKDVLPAILAGCAAAAVCSFLSASADITLLKKLLGWLLIAAGLREIFYRERNAR